MSGGGQRYTVVPTVTVLAVMKLRLVGATKGHALLKKKADALNMRFRAVRLCLLAVRLPSTLQSAGLLKSGFWTAKPRPCLQRDRGLY